MADSSQAWSEVGKSFESLGLKLKMHLEQGIDEKDRESVQAACHNIGDVIEQGFTSLGNAVRDPAVHEDVEKVAESIREALAATFEDAGSALRRS